MTTTTFEDCGATDRALLAEVADWADAPAWARFDATYRPMVRRWGRRLGFAGDDLEELCQVVMIALCRRLPGFRYDPSGTFRAWLRRVVTSRAVDLIRARRRAPSPIDADALPWPGRPAPAEPTTRRAARRDPAVPDEALRAVRGRVRPESWRAFWMVRVEGVPVAEVAALLGKTYAATYRNQQRVALMLRDEVERARARGDRSRQE